MSMKDSSTSTITPWHRGKKAGPDRGDGYLGHVRKKAGRLQAPKKEGVQMHVCMQRYPKQCNALHMVHCTMMCKLVFVVKCACRVLYFKAAATVCQCLLVCRAGVIVIMY
jgi:hypothetical protein